MQIHYSKDMKECPYCGSEEFHIKQSYKGVCTFNMRFDRENDDVENGDMYTYAEHKDLTKYAYCNRCDRRLFPIEEYYEAL